MEIIFIDIVVFFGCLVHYDDRSFLSEKSDELAEFYGVDNYQFFYVLSNKNHDAFTALRMVATIYRGK